MLEHTLPRFLQYFSFTCTVLRFRVVVNYTRGAEGTYVCIFMRAYLPEEEHAAPSSHAHLRRMGTTLYRYSRRARLRMTSERRNKYTRARTDNEEGGYIGWTMERWKVEKIGETNTTRAHLSSLDLPSRYTVCIRYRSTVPREFNSIFNLPKPLYANSATDVEYFWTFSSLFRVPFVSPSGLLPSVGTSLFYSYFSVAPSFLPFEFVERKEAHVFATSCCLLRMLHRESSGRS